MIELPEATAISKQINQTLSGKKIASAVANQSPHKFAWYTGDPALYNQKLSGKTIGKAQAMGCQVELLAEELTLLFSTAMRYYEIGAKLPDKHQLLLSFEDGSSFVCTVQMWGCMICAAPGEPIQFEDYGRAKVVPSPLEDAFTRAHFDTLFNENTPRLSAKQFLATEQRIPGLGNGVLQDILWTARIHPRRKMKDIGARELNEMYGAVKSVLRKMAECGGRDTERDLFGNPGGYKTVLSKNTVDTPCPECGTAIRKEAYLGGSIYYCATCQK
jgi:formamidopyrimidine-DNA glycosylase